MAVSKSPCFPMYPSDFFGDPKVRLMDGYEQALYAILLMNMWEYADSPHLPNDDQKLAKLLKISVKDWKKVKNSIFDCLIISTDKIESARLLREKDKQDKFRELQSEKGKKGGRPPKQEESHGFNSDKPEESPGIFPVKPPNPNPNPNPIKATTETNSKEPVDNSKKEASLKTEPGNGDGKEFLKEAAEIIKQIREKKPSPQFNRDVQLFLECNIRAHPKAIIHCMKSLLKNLDDIQTPKQYLEAALKIEDGKYNARDHEAASLEFKKPGMMSISDIFKQARG